MDYFNTGIPTISRHPVETGFYKMVPGKECNPKVSTFPRHRELLNMHRMEVIYTPSSPEVGTHTEHTAFPAPEESRLDEAFPRSYSSAGTRLHNNNLKGSLEIGNTWKISKIFPRGQRVHEKQIEKERNRKKGG